MTNAQPDEPIRSACAYVRVSTTRQAEHQTSLVEQSAVIQRFADQEGYAITETYVEPGASATSDRRPVLQQMMADALAKPRRFNAVIVYNFSRFFRDNFEFETYRRKLAKAKVELLSATQWVGEGPQASLIRGVITSMDAYASEVNAEQVKMVMAGNAAQGFWNGSIPPFGYRTYVAEVRGKKQKKKLELDPAEAPVARLIFDLKLAGDGSSGPMGVKKIAAWLNGRGHQLRGKPFSTGTIYAILTKTTYGGTAYYNTTDSRTREKRPQSEWIAVSVPEIVTPEEFDRVQRLLAQNSPKVTPPRVVSSPTLLTGVARCGAGCGGGLMLMTGKSGQYRYYTCASRRTRGVHACSGTTMRAEVLEESVLAALRERLLRPERLEELLRRLLDLSDASLKKRHKELKLYRAEKTRVEGAIHAQYEMVEGRFASFRDPIFAERMANHRRRLEVITGEIRLIEKQLMSKARRVTPRVIERFAAMMDEKLREGDPMIRKGYVQALVDEVIVSEGEIIVRGSRKTLELGAAALADNGENGVRSFVQGWRTRQDSNL